jgi:soluble lytic murein transglycosylase-like protein
MLQTRLAGLEPPASRLSPPPSAGGFGRLLLAAVGRGDAALVSQVADLMLYSSAGPLLGGGGAASALAGGGLAGRAHPAAGALQRLQALASRPGPGFSPPPPANAEKMAPRPAEPAPEPAGSRQRFDELARAAATRHGLDPNLVRAVITAESDWDPATVSHAGAQGLMQLMPETASDLAVADPFDPVQNIDGGARYLAMMLERFGGDEAKALAAYNWGPSNVEAGGRLPAETRTYLQRVARFKALYASGLDARA